MEDVKYCCECKHYKKGRCSHIICYDVVDKNNWSPWCDLERDNETVWVFRNIKEKCGINGKHWEAK